ncbi:unnamed protein product [Cuscuta campestris]|uniref:Uncharacterized protein n=1 Tax=Cuscuta campestris TaxID=132261 RepID=A0A484MSG0_9ASTE|nr:unnamed protein product [Cuscuta campestris]
MCQDLVGHTFSFLNPLSFPQRQADGRLSLVRPFLLLCSPTGGSVEARQSPASLSLSLSLLLFVRSLKQGRRPLVSIDESSSAAVTLRRLQRFQPTSPSRPSVAQQADETRGKLQRRVSSDSS